MAVARPHHPLSQDRWAMEFAVGIGDSPLFLTLRLRSPSEIPNSRRFPAERQNRITPWARAAQLRPEPTATVAWIAERLGTPTRGYVNQRLYRLRKLGQW